uniref:Arginyl aminopeptidase n=1 Tax=Zonotrichia albicollis TaxID=44394 RepID=A0A8D2QIN2_ZONAL
ALSASSLPFAAPSTGSSRGRAAPHWALVPPQVCWLSPEQTAGKQKPYMYTQGQAVLNRSFFPCFDTPSVKFTYSATVKVPEGFTAVMSATSWEKQKDNTFVFKMSQPIPSYLIALVVGDIVSADVGPRSRVWAEPCLIEAAKKEYDGVIEEFLVVGEKLFGPYVWGRYDILFMPPSFPFGGMENPCLTFVTPCLLAGDRSLADVIIHEISHSWFGNLVTNASWGEFWLNEGFTMYAQRRISTEVYGLPYTCLEAATGRALLRQHMDATGEDHPLNKLRVVIEPGINPDDTYNETPYEKGYCFVSYLAHLVGNQSKFDAFLQAYVNRFKFQSITADDTLGFFLEYFPELKEKGVDSIPGFEFDRWLNTPGWPPYLPDLSPGQQLMRPAEELAELWAADSLNMEAIEAVDIMGWRTYQLVYFLDQILQKSPLPEGNVKRLSKMYPKISKAQNAELRLRWCQIVLKNNLEAEYSKVKDFLHSQVSRALPLRRCSCWQDLSASLSRFLIKMWDFFSVFFLFPVSHLRVTPCPIASPALGAAGTGGTGLASVPAAAPGPDPHCSLLGSCPAATGVTMGTWGAGAVWQSWELLAPVLLQRSWELLCLAFCHHTGAHTELEERVLLRFRGL